ncbi:DUF6527 family protein [Limnoglobus roseus]|uniref:Uncharacterized protein n=1 Tax=Limnoglobus roseus TaxID=2598579 RepID=A0A5C1AGF1_9BACT|nr:DUF6527 family protein [Limnoglobus roseus]QEL16822.1 hypothetical protein PX52LOC_03795 [Limnoglobus roseus]
MIRYRRLEHRFVRTFPDCIEPGIFYVSLEFGTTTHSCCCGCGEEVVTPLSPSGWKITFDGETVSLWPSVGSWTLRCSSHYVIDRGRVLEDGDPTFLPRLMAEIPPIEGGEYLYFDNAIVCGWTRLDPGEVVLHGIWDVFLVRDGRRLRALGEPRLG